MEEIYENLDDIQHSSQFASDYITYEEGELPSQPQQNSITIYEVEVQDGDSPNTFKEISTLELENDKETNQATPPPSHETLNAENFEERTLMMRWLG